MATVIPEAPGLIGVITININPVFQLGPFTIHWYGLFYALAFIIAYRYGVLPLALRKGISRATAERITVWSIVFGLLGARLYYDVQQPNFVSNYLLQPINLIAFWNGGMAFFGAILAGFITLAVLAWRYRINPWVMLDGGVLFAVVGQPIGRIGNVINGDILGSPSTLPWATKYTFETPAGSGHCAILQPGFYCGIPYQPAAVYEALGTIVIGLILLLLMRRGVRDGVAAITYVGLYAVSQLILFEFRKSEPAGPLGLREAQWTAIVVLVVAVPLLTYVWMRTASRLEAMHTGAHAPPATASSAQ
jgi:phosphatidylglycerol:prolipoprotein diacylglycerol transferase